MGMKRELRDRWVAALRSGQYRQGHGSLQTGDGAFCCLGVLCDIQGAEGIDFEWRTWGDRTPDLARGDIYVRSGNFPPKALNGGLDNGIQHALATMNDDGRSFDEIDDYIEASVQIDLEAAA